MSDDNEERLRTPVGGMIGSPPGNDLDAAFGAGAGHRTDRATPRSHEGREAQERVHTESRVEHDDQRLDVFRNQYLQAILPELPQIDGYHVCWLTTTNESDSIHHRQLLGYELLKLDDFPAFSRHFSHRDPAYAGIIGVKEMVAAKVPLRLYRKYMREAHFEQPRQEEERLHDQIERIKAHADERGSEIMEGNGIRGLGKVPQSREMPFGQPQIIFGGVDEQTGENDEDY